MSGAPIRDKTFRIIAAVILCALAGCATASEKNFAFVADRYKKLQPLTKWEATWCQLETHLTQPALARYREMFPEEVSKIGDGTLTYTWKARKYSCELTPLDETPLTKNHQAILNTAMCMLLQTHWVNSPLEELHVAPHDIEAEKDGRIHVASTMLDKSLGIFLDTKSVKLETHTKGHGVIKADYTESADHEWLPSRIDQTTAKARLVIDGIEYDQGIIGGRHLIKSMWISVGDADEVHKHTQINFNNCQNF